MKCLVTGGAGFVGSHVAERLLNDGHDVVVLDNFASGRRENLDSCIANPALSFHEVDIADFAQAAPHFKDVDWVFHIAALADVVPSIEQPLRYHHSNVDGTIATLEAARQAGAKRLVYMASSSCYGLPDEFPTPETAEIRAMYPYALTKYFGEEYVMHWARTYGLPCNSLRAFNIFGPRARTTGSYGAVFSVFLAQKLAGKPLTVVGDGNQTRDFTFVSDIVNALVMTVESEVSGEIMNIGTGNPKSVNEIVDLLGGEVIHLPKRPGEPDCTQADVTKIRDLVGWRAEVPFEKGVEVMLEHIEMWRDAPVWTESSIEKATENWFRFLGRSPS
jgi:UDP-glucose 4-epimerase